MTRIAIAGATGAVGRHVVETARGAGYETVAIARSAGVDLMTGAGLDAALDGADAVIDVSSIGALSAKASVAFFETATRNLLAAERSAGVAHHVALSIIGAVDGPSGYYAGKAAQERMLAASGDRWSVLRAAQFHEFAAQMARRGGIAGTVVVPRMQSQPVSAAEVALELVEIAGGGPRGLAQDLAGPLPERMADLVRRYLRHNGSRRPVLEVRFPGPMGRVSANGGLLAGPTAKLGTQTFDEWLSDQSSS